MNIKFHPVRGAVLMCDFDTGFRPPEMVKCRPVVILSHRHREVCTLVPLSGTEPKPIEACHHEMSPESLPTKFRSEKMWAKCDMVTTVALDRLDRVHEGRNAATGQRSYFTGCVVDSDLNAIRRCVLHVLGLSHLTF